MIKCNECFWAVNDEHYVNNALGLEETLLNHYKKHRDSEIIRNSFTRITKTQKGIVDE